MLVDAEAKQVRWPAAPLRDAVRPDVIVPMLLATAMGALYLAWHPPSPDFAAQAFRSTIFSAHGFQIWNNDWYGGHYLPSYSVLSPPLGSILGPSLVGALAMIAAAGLFGALLARRFGKAGLIAACWFALATVTQLLSGRITFALGVPLGLGSVWALQRKRTVIAVIFAVLTGCASPVAATFLAIAGGAFALNGERLRGSAVAAGAIAPVALLNLAFPTPGYEPFGTPDLVWIVGTAVAALIVVPREHRAIRIGAALYALLAIALFPVHTALGANMVRLGALFAGPVFAAVLLGRRNVALVLVAGPLLFWQWYTTAHDVATALSNPAVTRGFFHPLIAELDQLAPQPVRLEIPPTRDRNEAYYVAPHFPLARGWLRQQESGDFHLFAGGNLTPGAYRRWLYRNGVSYVALAHASLDWLSIDEAKLIRKDPPYLHQVWSDGRWHLYSVRGSPGLVSSVSAPHSSTSAARITKLGVQSFTLDAWRPGRYLVRIHANRYWSIASGQACVRPGHNWTHIVARRPGPVRVKTQFNVGDLVDGGRSCLAPR